MILQLMVSLHSDVERASLCSMPKDATIYVN